MLPRLLCFCCRCIGCGIEPVFAVAVVDASGPAVCVLVDKPTYTAIAHKASCQCVCMCAGTGDVEGPWWRLFFGVCLGAFFLLAGTQTQFRSWQKPIQTWNSSLTLALAFIRFQVAQTKFHAVLVNSIRFSISGNVPVYVCVCTRERILRRLFDTRNEKPFEYVGCAVFIPVRGNQRGVRKHIECVPISYPNVYCVVYYGVYVDSVTHDLTHLSISPRTN